MINYQRGASTYRNRTSIILADEPTASIDKNGVQLISKEVKNRNITTIIVTYGEWKIYQMEDGILTLTNKSYRGE
ncbi:hypothetical protein MHH81_20190 [Psychrobacillus sp. FSL H8-0484]|uniref:hypothetical protein n=1 Tax=Psychrobacillus sp. FSL H8-0484 TaxID=2921390 RepID=UPI0030FCD142